MSGAVAEKVKQLVVLFLKYNDLGFAFGSFIVFLCSTVKSVRFQVSCF